MAFEDLYRQLAQEREAQDISHGELPEDPDQVLYRLGYASLPIAGMPEQVEIGRVTINHVRGPIATQQTLIRQRHGVPVVFDKSMELGVEVGAGQMLTICQIEDEPPESFQSAFRKWREEAEAALGVLVSALDDRLAIERRFEDVITLRKGLPLSSADNRTLLRTYLPFDVTRDELAAIEELATLNTERLLPLAEAARWYLKATHQGPTADGIVFMWIAIEALTPARSTSPKTVEAMLVSGGFNPEWLGEITIGRLAGLRAEIVHKGQRDEALIREGYYRLETVVRVLIRNAAGIRSSWAPVLSPGVFMPDPRPVFEAVQNPEVQWHEQGLPAIEDPEPAGLEWERMQLSFEATPPMEVEYRGTLEPGWQRRIDYWISEAAAFLQVSFEPLTISISEDPDLFSHGGEMRTSAEGYTLRADLLTLPSPVRELHLAQLLHDGLAQIAVMRQKIASESFGTTLIALAGSWALFTAFYKEGGAFAGDDFKLDEVDPDDLNMLGVAIGAALAGSASAAKALVALKAADPQAGKMAEMILAAWTEVETFPELLAGITEMAEAMRNGP